MEENLLKIVGEWYKKRCAKRLEERKTFKEKYWKLPAMERMHYDSCRERIKDNNHWSILYLTFYWMKVIILLPLGVIAMGFIMGDIITFMEIARTILISCMNILAFVIVLDCFSFIFYTWTSSDDIKKLNRRFKLIK